MGGCSLEAVRGLLIAAASLVVEPRLKGAQASVIMAPWALERELSSSGAGVSLFLRHGGSSQTRDRTPVSCTGGWVFCQ